MKAAVTEAPKAMRVADVPDAGEPEDGEVLVRPEAVGPCRVGRRNVCSNIYAIRHPAEVMKAMIRLEGA